MRDFSKIAGPLYALLKKDHPFVWTDREQASFERLKKAITEAPVLRNPDPNLPYTIHTDASDFALGAILLQHFEDGMRPICYHSRRLNEQEVNYATHEKEALAIVDALKTWKHYVEGSKGVVFTDHHALTHFMSQPVLTRRQARWATLLASYDVEIKYAPGKFNVVADALSRRADLKLAAVRYYVKPDEIFQNRVTAGYVADPDCLQILTAVHHEERTDYSLSNGLLYRQLRDRSVLLIPDHSNLRLDLIREHHDVPTGGHLGVHRTLAALSRVFYWPRMAADVEAYIGTCETCQRTKPRNQVPYGLLQPLPTPTRRWSEISMDLVTGLPLTARGHDALCVFVCRLSKRTHVVPTVKGVKPKKLAEIFFNHIWLHHGMPVGIVSDRDPLFVSNFWRALFKWAGTSLRMSTAYHPETDGQTERQNRTLLTMLRAYAAERPENWDSRLAAAEYAYNDSLHASTGYTPFYLEYGQDPLTPASLLNPRSADLPVAEDTAAFVTRLTSDLESARAHLARAKQRQAAYANRKRRDHPFQVGDMVLLSTENLASTADETCRKFRALWEGPFQITEALQSGVAFRLDLPVEVFRCYPVFHCSLLKPYKERERRPTPLVTETSSDDDSGSESDADSPADAAQPLYTERGVPVWEVDRILARRVYREAHWRQYRGKPRWYATEYEYKVRWANCGPSDDSWELKSQFRGAGLEAIEAFDLEMDYPRTKRRQTKR